VEVLLVGAGVIGTVYASELIGAGHSVTVLAHGPRTEAVEARGLATRDVTKTSTMTERVCQTVVTADTRGTYDLVLVAVWADQLPSVFASLRETAGRPVFLFFGNNPSGHAAIPQDLPGSVHLGFPGIGGFMSDGVVEFVRIPQQPTTLETGGGAPVTEFEVALTTRRFATSRTPHMDGWLAYHGVFVSSIAAALYRCNGSASELSRDRATLTLMCRSIEEGFRALRDQGVLGLPRNLWTLHRPWLRPVALRYWAHTMRSPIGERCFAAHARRAESEMRGLAADACHRFEHAPDTDHLRQLLQ
jgi:2-dehydropantoate 2-reductase